MHKAKGHQKEQKEFEEEVLQIDRVTRVVKGGRRLRFRATVAIGDKKGRVGIGVGKASEVVSGIKKAVRRAKQSLIKVPITSGDTIPHEVKIKHKAARLIILPASPGTGVIAGGSLRKILSLAGIKNVLSKNIGTRNPLVTAQASIKALEALRPLRGAEKKKADFKAEPKESTTADKKTEAPARAEAHSGGKARDDIKAEPKESTTADKKTEAPARAEAHSGGKAREDIKAPVKDEPKAEKKEEIKTEKKNDDMTKQRNDEITKKKENKEEKKSEPKTEPKVEKKPEEKSEKKDS